MNATPEPRDLRPTGARIPSDGELFARAVNEVKSLEAAIERLRTAARELLDLKDGPRDADYERRKPAAWQALRDALDAE